MNELYTQLKNRYGADNLYSGATDAEIADFEREFAIKLPTEFIKFYQCVNGQKETQEPRWLSLAEIKVVREEWRAKIAALYGNNLPAPYTDNSIQAVLFHDGWIPFMIDGESAFYCLDFAPAASGSVGQIIFVHIDFPLENCDFMLEAINFSEWLQDLENAYSQEFEPFAVCADYFQTLLDSPINKPASMADFHSLERVFGVRLPEEFYRLYSLFDGQSEAINGVRWLPLNEILNEQIVWQEELRDQFGEGWETKRLDNTSAGDRVQNCLFHPLWMPIFCDHNKRICIDFVPAPDGNIGQIISVSATDIDWEAENLEVYLEHLL